MRVGFFGIYFEGHWVLNLISTPITEATKLPKTEDLTEMIIIY